MAPRSRRRRDRRCRPRARRSGSRRRGTPGRACARRGSRRGPAKSPCAAVGATADEPVRPCVAVSAWTSAGQARPAASAATSHDHRLDVMEPTVASLPWRPRPIALAALDREHRSPGGRCCANRAVGDEPPRPPCRPSGPLLSDAPGAQADSGRPGPPSAPRRRRLSARRWHCSATPGGQASSAPSISAPTSTASALSHSQRSTTTIDASAP